MSPGVHWINGRADSGLDPAERALQYGDGVFETLPVNGGEVAYLHRHWQRLRAGCERLQLRFLDWEPLSGEVRRLAEELHQGVIKVIVGRGPGGRGYGFAEDSTCTRIISTHPPPPRPTEYASAGIRVRLCQLRMGIQPALAGIKHLNRLEQVLARAEWGREYAEGLLLDCHGRLVEGTMSNLFIGREGRLFTPRLDLCGVAGVLRSVLIDEAQAQGIEVQRSRLTPLDFASATEVFVCNSVFGIWPVNDIDGRYRFAPGELTRQLQQALAQRRETDGVWYRE